MFNARSETLYEKKTFRTLALSGNTCIWAIDGFYEWKEPIKNAVSNSNTKQPYFVHRTDGLPLIIPGLFTRVKTGRMTVRTTMTMTMTMTMTEEGEQDNSKEDDDAEEEETLETFTLITTAACQPLKWLHHRQPVFIWDMNLAREWILNPSQELMDQIATLASEYGCGTSTGTRSVDAAGNVSIEVVGHNHDDDDAANAMSVVSSSNNNVNSDKGGNNDNNDKNSCLLAWHPVSKRMSNVSYREADCMDEIKVEQVASIKSFFGAAARADTCTMNQSAKNSGGINIMSGKKTRKYDSTPKRSRIDNSTSSLVKKMKLEEKGTAHTRTCTRNSRSTTKCSSNPLKKKKESSPKKGSIAHFFAPKKP